MTWQDRFLAVAGFGNLPGDIALYTRTADNKFTPVGAVRADNGVIAEWAPDGRSLLVATTAPRLRVDNGFQLLRCAAWPVLTFGLGVKRGLPAK